MKTLARPSVKTLEVLGTRGAEGRRWEELVARLAPERRDLHFLPQYARIYERTYGYRAQLAVYGDEREYVLQPFVERSLNDLPFLAAQGIEERFVDIANPYGYGGPVVRTEPGTDDAALVQGFDAGFTKYCREMGYASEFASLHPQLGGATLMGTHTRLALMPQKEVVYIALARDTDHMWRGLRKGHKSSIGKARRSGAIVERVVPTDEHLRVFEQLYLQTMQRNQAQQRWYFPSGYFRFCFEELGDEAASLFIVRVGADIAAASILLHAFDTAYYHFSGSDQRYNELGVGTLLVFDMACWSARQGYRSMHLGGGVTASPDDGLFRFKSGFSPVRAQLHAYARVHDEVAYRRLCEIKRRFESAQAQHPESDYFPMYRR